MDVEDCIKEANRQLSDTTNYQKLTIDPPELFTGGSKAVTNNYKNAEQIPSKMANPLLPKKLKTPAFYLLPKIHKSNSPEKPVICSADCHTNRISEFVDHYLQPAVTKA